MYINIDKTFSYKISKSAQKSTSEISFLFEPCLKRIDMALTNSTKCWNLGISKIPPKTGAPKYKESYDIQTFSNTSNYFQLNESTLKYPTLVSIY